MLIKDNNANNATNLQFYQCQILTHMTNLDIYVCECVCLPEALDGKLFADIAFSLVFGGLGGSDAVEDRQPHHRLGLQAHPLQEVRYLNSRFPWGLENKMGLWKDRG